MELIILGVLFILVVLAVIWGYFIRVNQQAYSHETSKNQSSRKATNVDLYNEHKAEIEQDFANGTMDEDNYHYLLAELDKSFVQDLAQDKKMEDKDLTSHKPLNVLWPVSLSLFVLVFSLFFYKQHGAYELLQQPQISEDHATQGNESEQRLFAEITKLKDIISQEPNNTEAWYTLGQTYVAIGFFDEAIAAFDQIISIEGDVADLYGAKAQATYYRDGQEITAEVQALIDKALALDPVDPSTNILVGMHNFVHQEYRAAITYWEKVLSSGRTSVNREALEQAVAEAKNRLALTGQEENDLMPDSQAEGAIGPQLSIAVSLSSEIHQKMLEGEDKVVFIYATPTDGSRMPVAAVKLMASDLPTKVILNNARAMSPQANLSSVEAVNIYAVISQLGGAGIKSGDFKAEILNIDVNSTDTLTLEINSVVP